MRTHVLFALLGALLVTGTQAHRVHRQLEEHGKHKHDQWVKDSDEPHHKNGSHHHHGPHSPHPPFEPRYEVLNKTFAWELRMYNSSTWVSTNTSGWSWEFALPKAIKKLFAYTHGANAKDKHFPPAVPLVSRFLARQGSPSGDFSNCEKRFSVYAYLPRKPGCNATFPEPIDKSVELKHYPATKVFVKEFRSSFFGSFHWAFQREGTRLARALLREGVALQEGTFLAAVYDPPMKFFGRRNEVWFALPEKDASVESLFVDGLQNMEALAAPLTQPLMQTS